jgi:pimeloyl-ACP methyl ester carboxylesterase
MPTRNLVRFWVATCAAALIGLFAGRALLAAPAETSPIQPPLIIAKEGYLYAGGHYEPAHADHHIVGQLYVDFQIPANRKYPYPVVMVHGGSQTGADFWGTPDGREGWAQFFLRRGYSVYVVDQVGRGKSPYVPEAYGPMVSQSLDYTRQKFTSPERFNLWPQSHLHTQWPGTGEQGDVAFDQYFASSAPSMDNRKAQAQMNVDALAALLDRIGPAIILVHSQSGESHRCGRTCGTAGT